MTVRAHDVFCLYPTPRGHVAALRGLTLDVAQGERVVVHGPNGSGKTTLLRVLTGDHAPDAGSVSVCGVDLTGAGERERSELRAKRLGVVDQRHARTLRPELSIVDNVSLQLRAGGLRRRAARTRARELLEGLGLGALAERRAVTLSGGEAQRVAVCAAVAHQPALILADEPTGELNRTAADEVYDLLARVAAETGAALVLVSHDVRATRIADRVVRIRDGRLSEQWQPSDADNETLVVDDRGWVRLPEPMRHQVGVGDGVRAAARDGTIVLAPARPTTLPPPPSRLPAPASATPGGDLVTLVRVAAQRGGSPVLSGFDLTLRSGTLTVVSGPSGSGKTTLLRVLTGLQRPDSGAVAIGGQDTGQLDRTGLAALRRRYVAVAGQGAALAETLDVAENLALAREARGLTVAPGAIDHWLAALGLTGVRHRAARVLSGGERQRVAVARALAVEPTIAVFDEPTSQQDEANAERVVGVLVEAARAGAAVIAATHDPVLVGAADSVITLS